VPPVALDAIVARSSTLETVRAALPAETFDQVSAVGARMSLDEAVDLALRAMNPSVG